MFKFLRKYNKWILAVGGTLLMIVFLIPQAIDTLSRQAAVGSVVWATVGPDNKDVSASERRECESQLQALEVLQRASPGLAITDQPEHWYLLLREADAAGLTGAGASAQLPAQQMDIYFQLAGQSRTVDDALGNLLAINRMMQMYQGAGKLSDSRLRGEARRMFHEVRARILPVQASADTDAPDPTQAEIDAQFEKYSDVVAGTLNPESGEPGFGYRLPDRFKVEWITVSADSVREMIEAGDALNPVVLFKHWQRNETTKGFPATDPNAEIPAAVIEDLTQTLVDEALAEIERFMTDRIASTWRRLP
jgi:multidrug efflux pump subunit AcrA (membrane-fusion protein)